MIYISFIIGCIIYTAIRAYGVYVLFGLKPKKYMKTIAVLSIATMMFYMTEQQHIDEVFFYVTMFLMIAVIEEGSFRHKIFPIIKAMFVTAILVDLVGTILPYFIEQPSMPRYISFPYDIIKNPIVFIIFAVYQHIQKRYKVGNARFKHFAMITSMSIFAFIIVVNLSLITIAKTYVTNKHYLTFVDILLVVSYIGILAFAFRFDQLVRSNSTYQRYIDTQTMLRNAQKNNYELLLEKENDTRAFRHDIGNHLVYLKDMLESEKLEDSINYINQLAQDMQRIQKKTFHTGNAVVDAILNYHLNQLPDNIDIQVTGTIESNPTIDEVDLCTIIANPIQNAVEALQVNSVELLGECREAYAFIKVKLSNTAGFNRIEITNSHRNRLDMKNLKTTKEDKANHGFGLSNTKKAVQKSGGEIAIVSDEKIFKIHILLPKE